MNHVSQYTSCKISWLSFAAMWAVIVIHCDCGSKGMFQSTCLHYATSWAVPYFFTVSGVFLGLSYQNTSNWFSLHLVKKARSLVIPYILWCSIGFLIQLSAAPQDYLGSMRWWGGELLQVFGLTVFLPTGDTVLWFVRALLLFQVVVPIIAGCVTATGRFRALCLSLLFLFLALLIYPASCNFILLWRGFTGSFAFFVFGFIIAPVVKERLPIKWARVLFLCGGLFILGALLVYQWISSLGTHCLDLAIILTLWSGWDLVPLAALPRTMPIWGRCTFFVYCSHYLFLPYIKDLLARSHALVAYYSDWCFLALVLFMPPACVILSNSIRRFFPRTFNVLSGGR